MSLFYVYILTNKTKTVFYIDVTENIKDKVKINTYNEFVSKFKTVHLIYYKVYPSYKLANSAKFLLKKNSRLKQEIEIRTMNPEFQFISSID